MSGKEPNIKIKLLLDGGGWRIYHEIGEGHGHYVDVADYADIADYATSRRPRSELLEKYPQLRGDRDG